MYAHGNSVRLDRTFFNHIFDMHMTSNFLSPHHQRFVILLRLQYEEDHLGFDNLNLIREGLSRKSVMG